MSNRIPLIVGLALIVLIITALIIASLRPTPPPSTTRTIVAATIFPTADIARQIAGPDAQVIQLLPSGASPHNYSLTPQQLADLQNVQVMFTIGHGLDNWASDAVKRAAPQIKIVFLDQGIELRKFNAASSINPPTSNDNNQDSIDPHYWLTVPNGQQIANTITDTLVGLDPVNALAYQERLTTYQTELDNLEQSLQQQANQAPHHQFIAMHNAWSYLANHYGFSLLATYEPVEGRDPSIAELDQLQKLIQQYAIKVFFTEPQQSSTNAVNFIRDEFNLTIKTLDPLGGTDSLNSYQAIIQYNINALAS